MKIIDLIVRDLSLEGLVALIIIVVLLLRCLKQTVFFILFTVINRIKVIIKDGDIYACTHPGRIYKRGIIFCDKCPTILGTYPYEHNFSKQTTKKNNNQRVLKNGSRGKKKAITSKKIRDSKKRRTSKMEKSQKEI